MSKFKVNVIANCVGQMYFAVISILMTPIYVRYLGLEAYGLVGFFAMLQMWFQLMDFGLSQTMSRQTVFFRQGDLGQAGFRKLLRLIELLIVLVAVFCGSSIFFSAHYIANHWLKLQTLPFIEVQHCIESMAVLIGARWISGLYRGILNGLEKQVWLSAFNIIFITLKFVAVIFLFMFYRTNVLDFFLYQVVLSVIETVIIFLYVYKLLASHISIKGIPTKDHKISGIFKFSAGVAFTSAAWIFVSQLDKLLLSNSLNLIEYGYFSLAILIASAVTVLLTPMVAAVLPRLTSLIDDHNQFIKVYCEFTRGVCQVILPISILLIMFPEPALFAWTGNIDLATQAGPILRLYSLGNALFVITSFPSYMQFAKGDLHLHILTSLSLCVLIIPALLISIRFFGAIGAGYTWVSMNLLTLLIITPLVHHRFFPGLHKKWIMHEIIPILSPLAIIGAAMYYAVSWPVERHLYILLCLLVIGVLYFVSLIASDKSREYASRIISKLSAHHRYE